MVSVVVPIALCIFIFILGALYLFENAAKEKIKDEAAELALEYERIIQRLDETIEKERKDAVKKSKAVTRGQVSEQVIPLFEGFPYDIGEMKFLGQPFDFVLFQNMNRFRDGDKDVQINIIFTDVKTDGAKRTPVQNAIRKAIQEGRVRYEDWKLIDNKLSIK